ncbi:MAG: hypothetical protein K2Q06_16680 [Parvularculaceae bacterium]|nr:hypothetical protein [Parvularculaceae bacterium]
MRMAAVLAASALALAACGKKDEKAADPSAAAPATAEADKSADVKMPAGFPKMTANYKGVYTGEMDGKARTMTLEVAGWKRVRMETAHFNEKRAAAGDQMVLVMDDKEKRMVAFVSGPNAPKIAVVTPGMDSFFNEFAKWGAEDGKPPKKIGQDSVAGLSCDIWEAAPSADGATPDRICVTRDGIFLWTKSGSSEKPEMVATSIDRGSIDSSRFAVPAGFEIVDMGPCMKMGAEMSAAAQRGEKPDLSKLQECQAIGQKAAAVMGG